MSEREIVIDEYGFDEKGKLKHKKRRKTSDLKGWFDEEIGFDVLDKHYF